MRVPDTLVRWHCDTQACWHVIILTWKACWDVGMQNMLTTGTLAHKEHWQVNHIDLLMDRHPYHVSIRGMHGMRFSKLNRKKAKKEKFF